ncbi:hypothetical protein RCC94_12345 [Exiguobacterium acetylicum]|uniref:hypothetical protein n=1 Tax=Exiguobacterium TaxID=33986 RepID=UPI000A81CE71|nr:MULTISPECIES: hypothetical protein [Exiguobacterium]MDQ6468284.1 hypothetical protein [Exiguobacterium acetylicum]
MKHISLFLLLYTAVVVLTYIVSRFAPNLLVYMVYIAIASLLVITGYLLKRLVLKR